MGIEHEFYVLDLLMNTGADGVEHTAGVVAYELATGELHVFQAKAVLFATGGFGKVFKVTSNAHTLTGDGMGIVYRKGLPLEDMEFFQFHPTGIVGIGILLLPLHNPVEIAEIGAFLDVITGGRLISGMVRGIGCEYLSLGVNPTFSKESFRTSHGPPSGQGFSPSYFSETPGSKIFQGASSQYVSLTKRR